MRWVFLALLTVASGAVLRRQQSREGSLLQLERAASAHEATFHETPVTFHEAPLPVALGGPKVFIGIKSAPGNFQRRATWRESNCGKELLAAGIQYAFVVGEPLDKGQDLTKHQQGMLYTAEERRVEEGLSKEIEQFEDIMLIPERDSYIDLANKDLAMYSRAYSQIGAEYIMEADDDYCVHHKSLLAGIKEHEAKDHPGELYAGAYMFNGTEYNSMRGPHGEVAPYFSGNAILLSRGLVKLILEDDNEHSILKGMYGNTSEDATLGKWIQHTMSAHGVAIDVQTFGDLLSRGLSD